MTQTVAVLGTGKIGEALLSGMIRAGWRPANLLVTTRRSERAEELHNRYGVDSVTNAEAAKRADILILAVKPQDMGRLLDELAEHVSADRLVISAAAGITTAFIEDRLTANTPVVRVMPNTPVLVDEGMSVISAGSHATTEHLAAAEAIFGGVGKTLRVPESQQDAATALSGSGPAYFYFLVEAMTDAGILLGLAPRPGPRADRPGRHRRRRHAPRQRRTPGQAPRGRHQPGRHHHQRHPRAGEPRRTRRPHRCSRSRSRPQPRTRLRQRLTGGRPRAHPLHLLRTTFANPPPCNATAVGSRPRPSHQPGPGLTRHAHIRSVLRVVRRERRLRSVPGQPFRSNHIGQRHLSPDFLCAFAK